MHEFIRLVSSWWRRHLASAPPVRCAPDFSGEPDGLDMLATPDIRRIEGEFTEATEKYIAGDISYEEFRRIIDQRQTIRK